MLLIEYVGHIGLRSLTDGHLGRHLEYFKTLNDARVASVGFIKFNASTTRINKEKNFKIKFQVILVFYRTKTTKKREILPKSKELCTCKHNTREYVRVCYLFSFRNPNKPTLLRKPNKPKHRSFYWPAYEYASQKYLEISTKMTSESVKQRLTARKVEFWSNYLPSLLHEN